MFQIPVTNPPTSLVAWYQVNLNRLLPVVEVFYGVFDSEQHFAEVNEPRSVPAVISIRGETAQALCVTSLHTLDVVLREAVGQQLTHELLDGAIEEARQNCLYDWTRALIGRLLTGTATEQEQADCEGWQRLQQAVLVPGLTHLDPEPFPLPQIDPEEKE